MKLNLLSCQALLLLLLWPLPTPAGTIAYTYDTAGRLTGARTATGLDLAYAYDAAGNRKTYAVAVNALQPGDIDIDGAVTLGDAVLALKVLSGLSPDSPVFTTADINGNRQIDMAEAIFVLRTLGGLSALEK